MSFGGMLMRLCRALMSFPRVFAGGSMVALFVMFCSRFVGFRCVFVMFCSLFVRFLSHIKILFSRHFQPAQPYTRAYESVPKFQKRDSAG